MLMTDRRYSRLQQAILQPCAWYGCEVWAPADAAIVLLRDLQSLQHIFLRRACRVKCSIPIEVVFQELSVTPWHDFWWRQVLSYWNAMPQADSGSIINIVLHDAIAIAHNGCSYGWAAQVFKCFAEHGKSSPLVAGAPVEVQPDELQLAFQMQQQASFERERERENFTSPFSQHWLMRTRLCWSHQPH